MKNQNCWLKLSRNNFRILAAVLDILTTTSGIRPPSKKYHKRPLLESVISTISAIPLFPDSRKVTFHLGQRFQLAAFFFEHSRNHALSTIFEKIFCQSRKNFVFFHALAMRPGSHLWTKKRPSFWSIFIVIAGLRNLCRKPESGFAKAASQI